MKRTSAALLLIALAVGQPTCRGKSERERALELVSKIVKLADKRDVEGVMAHLSADYSDFEGRDRAATQEMVSDYFGRLRGIVIHLLSAQIDEWTQSRASIRAEISVSSGAAKVLREIFSRLGECYRFTLELGKENGEWRVRHAGWEWVSREGLFPESIQSLQRLFPD